MSKKRITEGPQFIGKQWVWIPLIIAFVLSILGGDWIANMESVPSDSLLPAIPAVICGALVLLYFLYNYRRNN